MRPTQAAVGPAPVTRRVGADRPTLAVVEAVSLSAPGDPWLSLKALAAHSSLSPRKLRDLLRDPRHPLPHYRIGGKILVRRGEYDRWAAVYRRVGDPDVARVVDDVLASLRPAR